MLKQSKNLRNKTVAMSLRPSFLPSRVEGNFLSSFICFSIKVSEEINVLEDMLLKHYFILCVLVDFYYVLLTKIFSVCWVLRNY
jgi:hypothetical protein